VDAESMALFTGNANPALAHDIARHLNVPLGRSSVGRFSDGEVNVEIMENVRGRDVFIVQPTSPPTNDHLMELLVMVDAVARRPSASPPWSRTLATRARIAARAARAARSPPSSSPT
jgi:ribose-phosphate pyrophosphokinase